MLGGNRLNMKFARLITFLMLATFGMAATVPIKNPLIQGTDGQIVSGAVLGNAGTLNGAGTFNFASGTVTLPSGQIITTPSIVGAITFPDGTRQTFNPNGTNAGINVGAQAGNPSSLTNGDLWYNSSTGTLNAQIAGSTIILGDGTVHGPVSATDGHIVQFDGVTGKLLKDGLATSTGGNDSADSGKVPLFNASGGMSITGGLGVAEPGLTGIEGSYGHDGMYINNNGTTIWQHIYANPTGARENFIPDHSGNFVLVGDTGTVTNAMLAGSIDLATKVTGNLAVSHFNSGTGATATTFWRGDGTWTVPAGGGDTIGPASATDGHIVQFDGTTGKLLKDGLATTSGGNGAADVGKVPVLNAYGGYFFGSPTVVNGADNVVKVQGTGGFSLAATTDTGTAIDGSPLGTGGGFQCHLGTTGTYGMIVDGTAALPTSFAFGAYTSGQVLSVADATTAEHLAIFGDGRFILRDSTAGKAITFSAPTGMAADLACNWPTVAGTLLTNNSGIVATQMPAFTGDVTTSAGAVATTLATVNSNVGSFTNANITVNAKGLITAASSGSSGVTIDSTAITTGTAGRVLFESATNKVSEDAALTFTTGTGTLTATKFSGALNGTVGATTPATGAFTTLSASGVVTVSAGTVSAPAITTTGDTNTGIFFSAADNINFVTGGVSRWSVDSGGTLQGSTNSIQLTGNTIGTYFYARGGYYAMGASDDVVWQRLAANHGVFARSTNAQSMSVANTFTNSSNYEALTIDWSSNVARIKPTAAGTGTVRTIEHYTTSTVFWSSGSGSPESVVTAPVGSLYTRTDGGANTTLYVKESGAGNTGWIAK